METAVTSKTKNNSQAKENNAEIVRTHIVRANRRDPNAKHIESAARQIQSKINNFNGPMNGRSAKVMPKSNLSASSGKQKTEEFNSMKVDEVEINEAPKGNPARPKSRMDIIRDASKKAAERAPGATPSWLLKATKMKKEEVEQVDELSRGSIEKYHDASWLQRRKLKRDHSSIYGTDPKVQKQIDKRERGLALAQKKMYKEEEIDEAKMNEPQKDAVKKAIDLRGKIGVKTSTSDAKKIIKFVKNEEMELEEGRGRPAKVGSAAWHRQQAAAKSGDGGEQEADKNIVNQMRKKPVGDYHSLVFNNGEKKQVHVQHVNKALSMLANTAKPADKEKLQNSFAHSPDRFMATIKLEKPVEDAARPKVSLGKMKAEAVDPETASSDRKAKKPFLRRDSEGVLRVHSRSGGPTTRDVVDAKTEAVTYYDPAKSEEAEEKKEGQGAPKGASADMTKDSCDRMQAMSPQAFKQKFKIPPTLGNVAAGGEDTVYGKGKYSVAEEKTLNNLYDSLSEENREIFDQMLQTEEGIDKLIEFARKQGF